MVNKARTLSERSADNTGTKPMIDAARSMLNADADALAREAFGLAALCVAILAGLFLPLIS
jgi:hypothetical protein